MNEKQFSGWAVLAIVAVLLSLSCAATAVGLFAGFQWGRATARGGFAPFFGPAPSQERRPFEEMPHRPEPNVPYLGVEFQSLTAELAAEHDLSVDRGAWITEVVADSPAEEAGLRAGDVIVAVDGRRVTERRTLRELILQFAPGDEVELEVRRGPREISIQVVLGRRPLDPG